MGLFSFTPPSVSSGPALSALPGLACLQLSDCAAVCGITLAGTLTKRLLIGWIVALIGSVAGLYFSFYGDFPSGAAIVCTFGALLVLVTLGGLLRPRHIPDM